MADSTEPKKETVRIALPPKPQPPGSGAESHETARINLPARPPTAPPRPPAAQSPLPPPPTRLIAPPPSAAPLMPKGAGAGAAFPPSGAMPAFNPPSGPKKETARIAIPGPKKETARITVLPDLSAPPAPAVQMKKTQPLSRMPEMIAPSMPVNVAMNEPEPEFIVADTPMSFCWGLLGVSTAILIIQIWIYVS